LIGLALGYSSSALAQEQTWLKDRRYGEGIGIRAGDLELHPGIAGEFGYDSNYLLRAPSENPIDTFRLRITPSFSLSTVNAQRREGEAPTEPPKVAFRAGIAASYSEFIATKSENAALMRDQRNVGASGNLQLTILPQRPFSVDLGTDFLRTVQPSNDPTFNYNRISARFGGGVTWAPGGGMFDWRLGYEYGLTYFEDVNFRNFSTGSHQINTRGRWRFLPRTALMYDASAAFIRYNNNPASYSLNSNPVRARIGLNGLVTPWFAFLGMIGWASSFYEGVNAQQYDGLIAQAELKWYVTPNPSFDLSAVTLALSSIAVGYTRDFTNSYLGDFYARNRGYATLSYFFGGQFLLVLDGGVAATRYPTIRGPVAHGPFTAIFLDPSLFGEYRFTNTVGINTTLRYTTNITDVTIGGDALKWNRFEAFLGVRWFI
jgi:hypothetical protein